MTRLRPLAGALLLAVSLGLVLAGCSLPADVANAERAAAKVHDALSALPAVQSVLSEVDDGGFDAGIRRYTVVTMDDPVTVAQIQTVVSTWNSLPEGGAEPFPVGKGENLNLKLAAEPTALLMVDPGLREAEITPYAAEWAQNAFDRLPSETKISRKVLNNVPVSTQIVRPGISPSGQAALLERLNLATREDPMLVRIQSGPRSSDQSRVDPPMQPALPATLRGFEAAFAQLAEIDPQNERAFRFRTAPGEKIMVEFTLPAALAPDFKPKADNDLAAITGTAAWPRIQAIMQTVKPAATDLVVGFELPSASIGAFSAAGCPPPKYPAGGQANNVNPGLQDAWLEIQGLPAPTGCPRSDFDARSTQSPPT